MRALLLAAGLGTRLRPLTDYLPKPLCLFMGEPILDLVYKQVRRIHGLKGVAVNSHHLAPVLQMHIQKEANVYTEPVHISFEQVILGTGGCLNPLRGWLAGDDLMIYNGDVIADLDLNAFAEAFASNRPVAAMALLPYKPGTTPVFVANGEVKSIGSPVPNTRQMTFSGIHILSSRFIDRVPPAGFLNVIDTYREFLAEGASVLAYEHGGFWEDLGTPQDYLKAHRDFWRHPKRDEVGSRLGLAVERFSWDPATESLYTFPTRDFAESCRQSFVFGPISPDSKADGCIVYPMTRLNRHEVNRVVTPVTSLNMG